MPLPDENDKSLGACLKRQRLALEWTQEDTAKHFGVLKDSYQKWEWNRIIPRIENKKAVVDFLGYNYWDDGTISLSNRVLLFRIDNKFTISELAKKITVSSNTINRVENNSSLISDKMKIKINDFILKYV